jgi:hypothetical protein
MKTTDFRALILNVLLSTFAFADATPLRGLSSNLAFQPSSHSVGLATRTSSCHSQQPLSQQRHNRVSVYDGVVSVAFGFKLVTEIKRLAGDKLEMSHMLPVPSSLHEKIKSIMQVDGTYQVMPRQDSKQTVLVPARITSQGISPHQVCSRCC